MTLLNRSGSDSQLVITTRVGRFMAWCRHSTGEAVLLRTVAHRTHPEQGDVVRYEHGENFLFEAVVKCVHDVERHPHGIEGELVREGPVQHLYMNIRTPVKPTYGSSPCFLAASSAFILPSALKIRAGSESRITS